MHSQPSFVTMLRSAIPHLFLWTAACVGAGRADGPPAARVPLPARAQLIPITDGQGPLQLIRPEQQGRHQL